MNETARIEPAQPGDYKARFTTSEFRRIVWSDAFEDWRIELIDGGCNGCSSPSPRMGLARRPS